MLNSKYHEIYRLDKVDVRVLVTVRVVDISNFMSLTIVVTDSNGHLKLRTKNSKNARHCNNHAKKGAVYSSWDCK